MDVYNIALQIEDLPHTTIVPCWRHGEGYKIIRDLGYQARKKYKVVTEGFITHEGKFLNRVEAFKHVKECGQCNATQRWYWEDHKQTELYSEDLY